MRYLLILFVGGSCFAQPFHDKPVDAMRPSVNYIAQFDSLYARAREYGNAGKSQEALPYAKHAYAIGLLSADSLRIVRGGRVLSQLLLRLSREDEALKFALSVLPIAERNSFDGELSIIYNSLGGYYALVADYHKALTYHFKSLEIRQASGDGPQASISYHNLGFVYYKLQDYPLALDNFNKALELKLQSGNVYDLPVLLINIGLCHSLMGDHHEARKALDSSLVACKPYCNPSITMQHQFAFGVLYHLQDQIDHAEASFLRSYEVALDIKDDRFQAENLLYFARIASARSNPKKALEYLKLLEKICLKENYNLILERAYQEIVTVYRELGRNQEAWLYQDRYLAIKDKVFNERIANKILQIHSEYEAKHRQMLKSHNLQIVARQKVQNIMAVSIVVILFALAIALYVLVKQKQRINVRLGEKVKERTRALELNERRLVSELAIVHSVLQKGQHDFKAELMSIQGLSDYLARVGRSEDINGVLSLLNNSISRLDLLLRTFFSFKQNAGARNVEFSEWVQTLYYRMVQVKEDLCVEQTMTRGISLPENHPALLMSERILYWTSFAPYPVKIVINAVENDGRQFLRFVFAGLRISRNDQICFNCVADGQTLRWPVQFRVDGSDTHIIVPISAEVSQSESFQHYF